MKLALVGRELTKARALFAPYGKKFTFVETKPDIAVSYGGDGTLMLAEHWYPGVPKVFLRNSRIAKLAHATDNQGVVAALADKKFTIEERMKLDLVVKGVTLTGLNDIVIHNTDPRSAIRYEVCLNGKKCTSEIIGDGIVVSTPLGSTAYYRSITDSYFETGIGLAFNNSTEQADHIVLREDRVIDMTLTRGTAHGYADNQKKFVTLKVGDTARIKKSRHVARLVVL